MTIETTTTLPHDEPGPYGQIHEMEENGQKTLMIEVEPVLYGEIIITDPLSRSELDGYARECRILDADSHLEESIWEIEKVTR